MTHRLLAAALVLLVGIVPTARADETCMSPYLPKITGQEDYVYVWTLGVDGLGDGSDKLVTGIEGTMPSVARPRRPPPANDDAG